MNTSEILLKEVLNICRGKSNVPIKDWHNYLEKECGDKVIVGRGWIDAKNQLLEILNKAH